MSHDQEILIDLDQVRDDPEVLAKLYECASLMVQSDNAQQVEMGYRMLELVDQCMKKIDG